LVEDVVVSLFSEGYQIKRDVPISGANPADEFICKYVIFDSENKIKLMIATIPHNGDRNRRYYNFKAVCIASDIPFVNFFTHMANERTYVEERIKSALQLTK
jgi:hypothetical protein